MFRIAGLSLLVVALCACTSGSGGRDAGGDEDGQFLPDGSDTGADLPGDGTAGEGGGDIPVCNEVELGASPRVNLLLVVDRSDSMKDPTSSSTPGRTKAQDLTDALRVLLDDYRNRIRFGWMVFPYRDGDCDPGQVLVPVGDDSADQILALLDSFIPWGGTPTGESLQNAKEYFVQLGDSERQNFVLLITDGIPTCPNGGGHAQDPDDAQLAMEAVQALAAAGVGTFVVGLGEDLNSSNPQLLNEMAVAGGYPRNDATKYHPASSLDELRTALDEIAATVFDCSFTLEVVPEQPDWVWVFFDGDPVPHDPGHQEGYDYLPATNAVEFYGSWCDKLRQGLVGSIEIKMGCAPPK